MSAGAHHMYAFQIPAEQAAFNPSPAGQPQLTPPFTPDGKKTPVFDCPAGGLEFHPYFHLTQRPNDTLTYPDGIGRSLKASEAIRFNVHYLNTASDPIDVGASVTVDYKKPGDVTQLAAGIFIYAPGLQVPPGTSTKGFSYVVPQEMSFLQLTGHMHRHGTHYEAHLRTADGKDQLIYSTDSWDDAPTGTYSPPLTAEPGDTIDYSCTFDNGTGMTFTYGESAANNEMCNLFGVFFPAPDGNGIYSPILDTN